MIKLDIIIPQYKETDNEIKKTLDSIAIQRGIDFSMIRTIIVNDASNVILSNDLLNNYPFEIIYLKNKTNLGPGLTRQTAIDYSDAKYVLFLDADDLLFNDISLHVLLSCIEETNKKLVITNFYAEAYDNNNKLYLKEYKDGNLYSALHAKIFDLNYLKENNIRFSDKLRDFEDSYFMSILYGTLKDEDVIKLDLFSYLWKSNLSSITRANKNEYIILKFQDFFNCPFLVYDFLNNYNSSFKNDYLINGLFGIFIMLNSGLFTDINLKNKYSELFKEKLLQYKNIFNNYKHNQLHKLFDNEYLLLSEASDIKKKLKYNDFMKVLN